MNTLIRTFAMIFAGCVAMMAAADNQSSKVTLVNQPCDDETSISIHVSNTGEVIANHESTSIESFAKLLEASKSRLREICYSREDHATSEPHPNAFKVLDAIVATQLPVAFYWDKGFTKRIKF